MRGWFDVVAAIPTSDGHGDRRVAGPGAGAVAGRTVPFLSAADLLAHLAGALAAQPSALLVTPVADRVGAVLVLLAAHSDDVSLLYTRRREDLRSHPGQISFPGGRVDPGETVEQAALREAREEVGVRRASVDVLGRLPAMFIPPSGFWLQPVVGRWLEPHALTPAEAEVAEVLTVPLAALRRREVWRSVQLSTVGPSWAWLLDGDHVLWGATAVVTATLLGLIDPGWAGGLSPTDVPAADVTRWTAGGG